MQTTWLSVDPSRSTFVTIQFPQTYSGPTLPGLTWPWAYASPNPSGGTVVSIVGGSEGLLTVDGSDSGESIQQRELLNSHCKRFRTLKSDEVSYVRNSDESAERYRVSANRPAVNSVFQCRRFRKFRFLILFSVFKFLFFIGGFSKQLIPNPFCGCSFIICIKLLYDLITTRRSKRCVSLNRIEWRRYCGNCFGGVGGNVSALAAFGIMLEKKTPSNIVKLFHLLGPRAPA